MTWPFTSFSIGAFRGLRDLSLDGLGRINLLVGGTNSGKTSVLEALSIIQNPADPLTWLRTANRREPSPFASMMTSSVDRVFYLFPAGPTEGSSEVSLAVQGAAPVKAVVARMTSIQGLRPATTLLENEDGSVRPVQSEVERRGLELDVQVETAQKAMFTESKTFQIWEGEPVQRAKSKVARMTMRSITPYDHWLRPIITEEFSQAVVDGEEHAVIELLRE